MRRAVALAAAAALAVPSAAQEIHVACVGDSLTLGAGVADPERNAFPVQLARFLGEGHEVTRHGIAGATLSMTGEKPFLSTPAYVEATWPGPDVAVVLLGTNDVQGDGPRGDLRASARALAEDFRKSGLRVRVLLCAPPPVFPEAPGLDADRAADLRARAPRLQAVRAALRDAALDVPNCAFVDTGRVLDARLVPDGVHPDARGAEAIARRIAETVLTRPEPFPSWVAPFARGDTEAAHHGSDGFLRVTKPNLGGQLDCSLVVPHFVADGHPWVLRFRRGDGLHPVDLALLDRGVHVVRCRGALGADPDRDRAAIRTLYALGSRAPASLAPREGASRHENAALLDATLRALDLDVLPTSHPVPSAETRGAAAGWGSGTWWDALDHLRAVAAESPRARVVFLGDSITQGLTGHADRVARPGGERAFDRRFGDVGALSLGLSGDRTEHVAWRVEHGALARLTPRVVVLQVGVNDVVASGRCADQVVRGIDTTLVALAERQPWAEVVACGPFPTGAARDDPARRVVDAVHDALPALCARRRATYVDLRPLFLDDRGRPNGRMEADRVHVTAEGRDAWLAAVRPTVDELLTY